MRSHAAEKVNQLSEDEMARYSRHVLLPEIGVTGQERLKRARVLIVGMGGLGCPAAIYLASAGVGRIGIADFDMVDASNLQRQVLFRDEHIGFPKAAIAAEELREINPHVRVDTHPFRVAECNAFALVQQYDVVLDCCDNVESRYALNAACVTAAKPYIYGSVYRFEGQVSVFGLPGAPCYACLFPTETPVPCTCAQGGVLGVAPGIIGTFQAAEAIKLALNLGDSLSGRLLVCDLFGLRFYTITVPRDPACPCCGYLPTDIAARAPIVAPNQPEPMTAEALFQMLDAYVPLHLLDIREAAELLIDPLPGAIHIPLSMLPSRLDAISDDRPVVVYCRRGVRSTSASMLLMQAGFTNVRYLVGGIYAAVRIGRISNLWSSRSRSE